MNRLSDAEQERFGKLVEEQGEAGQCIGKIFVHGRVSEYLGVTYNNIGDLEREIGDLLGVIDTMILAGDLNNTNVQTARSAKLENLPNVLNHQSQALISAMRYKAQELRGNNHFQQ